MVDTTLEKENRETREKNVNWRQRQTSRRKISLAVIYILLFIGAFLVLLAGLAKFVRDLTTVIGSRETK